MASTNKKQIERIEFLTSKLEQQRTNVISRATGILTAGSLVLASFAFFGSQINTFANYRELRFPHSLLSFALFALPIMLGVGATVACITSALLGVIHIRKRSTDLVGVEVAQRRLYVHCRETVTQLGDDYERFRKGFREMTDGDYVEASLADLWSIYHIHTNTYGHVRRSGIWLMYACGFLVFAMLYWMTLCALAVVLSTAVVTG